MLMDETDALLIEKVKHDDHRAFKQLVDRYWEDLYKHVYYRIKDQDETKDIIQDVFISLWRNRFKVNTDSNQSMASYLFKSAKYAVIDYFARSNTVINRNVELSSLLSHAEAAYAADSSVAVKELGSLLNATIEELPERLKTPFLLSREKGYTIKEIAAFLEVSEQTVKNNISITLDKLRNRVKDYDPDFLALLVVISISVTHSSKFIENLTFS